MTPLAEKHGSRFVIITSSPLRISLGGGGTDLPSYYREHGGFVMFYTEDQTRFRHVLMQAGLREVRFRFDFSGSQVLVQS
jgi:galactokinase/mevalonate kinase-like predicted kinase